MNCENIIASNISKAKMKASDILFDDHDDNDDVSSVHTSPLNIENKSNQLQLRTVKSSIITENNNNDQTCISNFPIKKKISKPKTKDSKILEHDLKSKHKKKTLNNFAKKLKSNRFEEDRDNMLLIILNQIFLGENI